MAVYHFRVQLLLPVVYNTATLLCHFDDLARNFGTRKHFCLLTKTFGILNRTIIGRIRRSAWALYKLKKHSLYKNTQLIKLDTSCVKHFPGNAAMSQYRYFYINSNPILFMFGILILQLSEWLEIERNNFMQHLHVILGKISCVKVVQTMTHSRYWLKILWPSNNLFIYLLYWKLLKYMQTYNILIIKQTRGINKSR